MDHYCVWLNVTIGHKNHRTFLLFLLLHLCVAVFSTVLIGRSLHREMRHRYNCELLLSILGRRCFFVVTLCSFMVAASLGLLLLSLDQLSNILANLVR